MSKKASKEALARLHAALAEEMKKILEEGVVVETEDGPAKITPGAPYLNVIRQFLKDNSVENLTIGEEINEAAKPKVNLPFTSTDEYGLPN